MRRTLWNLLGALFSAVPPAVATLSYFPLWVDRGAVATVSGLCAFLLVLCALPLVRLWRKKFTTPSLPLMWGILFLTVRALSPIIDEVCVISFVGLLSGLVSAIFFRLAREERSNETG